MNTDEQYGRRIGDQLREATDDIHADPDLMRRLRKQQSRNAWTLRTTIGVPVAAAVAAIALVATAGTNTATGPTGGNGVNTVTEQQPTEVQLRNVAYVQEQTLKAVGQAKDYVIFERNTYAGGHHDTWFDKRDNRYRNDVYSTIYGDVNTKPGSDRGVTAPEPGSIKPKPLMLQQSHAASGPMNNRTIVTVDWMDKWWSVDQVDESDHRTASGVDVTDPESMRAALKKGKLELLGEETIDGKRTLHLGVNGDGGSRFEFWVDVESFLPVQSTAKKGGDTSGGELSKWKWLPRTPENLDKLTLTAPPGFKKM